MSKVIREESAFDKIRQGLEEAYAFAKGDKSAARLKRTANLLDRKGVSTLNT